MQIKLFTIPVGDSGSALDEMNHFLKGNKILEVENHLISRENGAYWCFCVRYIERTSYPATGTRTKVDYKQVLDPPAFQKFTRLREIRKKVAADEGIPAFGVFTDEELAGLSKLETITQKNMLSVKGIGDKKTERFGRHFITKDEKDETTGTSD
ncbi:MAG: helicase [Planctomycetes bacterium]|nr:helicase [Planctomycetota bacterium]